MASKKLTYMVGICCSETNGVRLSKVTGTEEQVKQYLAKCVREDKANDKKNFEIGTTSARDVEKSYGGELNAFAMYCNYHIDYTATPETEPIVL